MCWSSPREVTSTKQRRIPTSLSERASFSTVAAKWQQTRCSFVMNSFEQSLALCISTKPGRWEKTRVAQVQVGEEGIWRKGSIVFVIRRLLKESVPTRLNLSWRGRRGQHSPGSVSAHVLVRSNQRCLGKPTRAFWSCAPGACKVGEGKLFAPKEWWWVRHHLCWFSASRNSTHYPQSSEEMQKPKLRKSSLRFVRKFISLRRLLEENGLFFTSECFATEKKSLFEMFLSHFNISVKESAVNYSSRMMASVISF